MDELEQLIHNDRQDKFDEETKENIYSYIVERFLPQTHNDTQCPPMHVLTYTIRTIIRPSIAYPLIPDLLRLLFQVEHIRSIATQKARDVQIWNKFYAVRSPSLNSDEGIRLLSPTERKAVASTAASSMSTALRTLYVTIVTSFCCVHIYRLWTAEDSYRLPSCMRLYFPSLYPSPTPVTDSKRKPSPVFDSLTVKEKEELHNSGLRCKAFIAEAGAWEQRRRRIWQERGLPEDAFNSDTIFSSYTNEFHDQFPPLVDESRLVTILVDYLKEAESTVDTLQEIFTTNSEGGGGKPKESSVVRDETSLAERTIIHEDADSSNVVHQSKWMDMTV